MSAICETGMSMPVATFSTSPAMRSMSASMIAVIASASSSTYSQSRLAWPSPWIVSGSSLSACVMNRGIAYSGFWNGP